MTQQAVPKGIPEGIPVFLPGDIPAFLDRLKALDDAKELDDAFGLVLKTYNGLYWQDRFDIVDAIMDQVDVARFSADMCVGFVCFQGLVLDKLKRRRAYQERAHKRIADEFGKAKADSYIVGFNDGETGP